MNVQFTLMIATVVIFDEAIEAFVKSGVTHVILHLLSRKLTGRSKLFNVETPEECLSSGLSCYKSIDFDEYHPISVRYGSAIDAGGPKREFFDNMFKEIILGKHLMPLNSPLTMMTGILQVVGKVVVYSLVQEGPGFPFLSRPMYWLIVTGTVEDAMHYATISDAISAGSIYIIEKVIL